MPNVILYAGLGSELTCYRVDAHAGGLRRQGSVTLPAEVQYAVPDRSAGHLFVASSNRNNEDSPNGAVHHLTTFRIAADTGLLTQVGAPGPLPDRPIHLTADGAAAHLLVAFSDPAGLRVYKVNADGTPGEPVPQADPIETGIYPHQVRVTPDQKQVILVSRGHDPKNGKPEEPGCLKVFDYRNGRLSNEASIAPNGGFGFGPRHLDFHPTGPWIYVALERQNRLQVFSRQNGRVSDQALFTRETLADPARRGRRQLVGTVRVHPSGRFVYVANRGDATVEEGGQKVFAGGENNFAVYRIDAGTGEPALIQHIDTGGIHCRNFQLDSTGRLLAASHIQPVRMRRDGEVVVVPPCISLFRVGEDGKLTLLKTHEVAITGRRIFWMGLVEV
ncbi:MAG TPA: beta-propeller fold lactonase family protein [Rhodopila sp.]|uniref:lactonase family protein n=1 Tax=Rhodopila sp. TaxID=2480087 RepID=UPI002C9EBF70|nr:beta-propeller fold lactonase family protein [Rhodopila sp.]HVY14848.1 beta-propeller fold lactonase family protein [Rhodopila sp.]